MKYIFKLGFLLMVLSLIIACTKEPSKPTDETIDKGHENPDRVDFIFTEVIPQGNDFEFTTKIQKRIYAMKGVAGVQPQGDDIVWEAGKHYHLEIVYYNKAGQRMNHEFVSSEMSPIHQHFFTIKGKKTNQMNQMMEYVYRDTNPENGYLGQNGVTLRKRSWDKNNPEAIDPIGLKGVFSVKSNISESIELQSTLAHFLGQERGFNKLHNGNIQQYNELPSANFFSSDASVIIPIKIESKQEEAEISKVELVFTEGHTHGKSFHGDAELQGIKYLVNKQTITFEYKDKQWKPSEDKVIRWRQSSHYGLEIIYYNDKNERVNSELIEEADSHQHFFQFENVQTLKTGTLPNNSSEIAPYLYRDTNPENKYYDGKDKSVSLLNNPIGLKGYFHVQQKYLSFDMKITLAHFISGNKKNGNAYFAYNELPSPSIAVREFVAKIPIRIYTDRLERNDDIRYQDMMDEFNITRQEAEDEEDAVLEADINPESSQVWM